MTSPSFTKKNVSTRARRAPAMISNTSTAPVTTPPCAFRSDSVAWSVNCSIWASSRPRGPVTSHSRTSSAPWRTVGPSSSNSLTTDGTMSRISPAISSRNPRNAPHVAARLGRPLRRRNRATGTRNVDRNTAAITGSTATRMRARRTRRK
jgi:hypothetical protein